MGAIFSAFSPPSSSNPSEDRALRIKELTDTEIERILNREKGKFVQLAESAMMILRKTTKAYRIQYDDKLVAFSCLCKCSFIVEYNSRVDPYAQYKADCAKNRPPIYIGSCEDGDMVVLVRLYARRNQSAEWPISSYCVGIAPLLLYSSASHTWERSVLPIGVVDRHMPVASNAREMWNIIRMATCPRDLKTNPSGCGGCAGGVSGIDWSTRLQRSEDDLKSDVDNSRSIAFYEFHCPLVSSHGASRVVSGGECNRFILKHEPQNLTARYSILMDVSSFDIKVAEMQLDMGGRVDPTLLHELIDVGFYQKNMTFKKLLSKYEYKRVECIHLDHDVLQQMLRALFQKGYIMRRFEMLQTTTTQSDEMILDEKLHNL